jgi:hypothetical protein
MPFSYFRNPISKSLLTLPYNTLYLSALSLFIIIIPPPPPPLLFCSYCVQQTVKAKEHKTSCERYIELKMENNKFIVRHGRERERKKEGGRRRVARVGMAWVASEEDLL